MRGCSAKWRASAGAAAPAPTRTYSVRMPRSSSQASNGAEDRAGWARTCRCVPRARPRARRRARRRPRRMAVEVLGRRMHHDIGAERERPGEHRRRDGGVDCRGSAPAAMRDRRLRRDVGDAPHGLAGVSIHHQTARKPVAAEAEPVVPVPASAFPAPNPVVPKRSVIGLPFSHTLKRTASGLAHDRRFDPLRGLLHPHREVRHRARRGGAKGGDHQRHRGDGCK